MCPPETSDKHTRRQPQVISLEGHGIGSSEAFGNLTVWRTYSFAPEWFRDAKEEASRPGPNARRREIVMAACAAESYLLEWVRDSVLQRDFRSVENYFPPSDRRGILDKWKEVPKKLNREGLIPKAPDLGSATWVEFRRLVEFRNGLIHASSSRPETDNLPTASIPYPSKSDLDGLEAGWATRAVFHLIVELNTAAATRTPAWLTMD
jgi:hypothetical protein